jgi:cytosine/uracil/thiamine/allantoin permease
LRKKDFPYFGLIIITIIGLVLLPFAIVKRSFKDWIIVYLVSFIGNYFSDKYLVARGYLKYPKNFFQSIKSTYHLIIFITL